MKHETPPGHPERVARLEAILKALEAPEFAGLLRLEAPLAKDEDLLLAHPAAYVERVKAAAPAEGYVQLDPDTWMSPGSLTAALRAAGAQVKAVDLVLSGEARNAFIACRPPGHHTETARPMGFCIFGNVVIAARHALERHGLSRVAIVDFDVHHGNGTQDLVWNDRRIFFASTHQMPLYPGSGAVDERGAFGQIVNAPLPVNSGGALLRQKLEALVFPALEDFRPELVLISAGFDAHARDPLANLNWLEADYAWVTGALCDIAERHCGGRVVSTLEGGYDLQGLAGSVAAHVAVMMERSR
ncbi:MAG TPA: histone deacetylase family protein [Paracoccaceae bacterium]|nr:histone deacetylase family protein [Paracoccaceae bacterium]